MSLILHSSRRTRFIAAFTLSLLFVVSTTISAFASATATVSLTQLSSDPYLHNPGQHKTEVEPDSYSVGSTIVSAFQVGRFSNGGSDNTGWATSTDSGRTWTNGFLPVTTTASTPPRPYARVSDASVAYDAEHNTWMITSLALTVSFS